MKFQHPFNNFIAAPYPKGAVLQGFGENPKLYSSICYSGKCLAGHNGADCISHYGDQIFAVADGVIGEVKEDAGGYGKHIRLITSEYEVTYGHLSEIFCETGQPVIAGEVIGLEGNTGFVVSGQTPFWNINPYRGTHLHLGVRKIKQVPIQEADLHYANSTIHVKVENYDNGYFGAIDPLQFFDIPILSCKFGDSSNNIKRIQQILMRENYMPVIADFELGYYGNKTRKAVLAFQQANLQLSWYELNVLRGMSIGPKTLPILQKKADEYNL